MNKYLLNLGLIATFIFGGNVWGQTFTTIAEDDASNYGSGWTNGSNGGEGFEQWSLNSDGFGGFAGHFFGSTPLGDPTFGMFSGGNVAAFSSAERGFTSSLQPGDKFSVDVGHTPTINGELGLVLLDGTTVVFTLKFVTGGSSWAINDGGSDFGAGQNYQANTPLTLEFTFEGNNQYSYSFGNASGSNFTFSGSVTNIDGVRFFSVNQGPDQNFGIDNLKIERPTYTTANDGDFYNASTWVGEDIPATNGIINIEHNVILDADYILEGELNIASGKTLAVAPSSTLTNNGSINVQGDLLFSSTTTGTAQYGNSSGTINGNVTVERFIPKRSDNARAFRFLSSPVSDVSIANSWQENMHVTGAGGATNGFDATDSNSPSMFTFDEGWQAVGNTNVEFVHGRGYRTFVRGDRTVALDNNTASANDVTLSAKGTLATGSVSAPDMATGNHEFSFVGNPYQAVVDLGVAAIYGDGIENGFAYYWDPTLADSGAFVTITTGNSDNATVTDGSIPSPGSTAVNKFLQPGQAVFFRNTNTAGDRTITFTESAKQTGQAQTAVFSEPNTPYVNMRLYEATRFANGGKEQDATGLRFFENGNNGIDAGDASKMGNSSENFAMLSNNQLISIESRSLPQEGEIYPLFTNNYQHDNYVFHINIQNFPEDLVLRLNDNHLNEIHTLETGINEIHFSVDLSVAGSTNSQRFSLEVGSISLSVEELAQNSLEIYPNPVTDVLSIRIDTHMQAKEVSIYNLMGKEVARYSLDASKEINQISTTSLSTGVYLVQIQTSEGNFTQKLIKK